MSDLGGLRSTYPCNKSVANLPPPQFSGLRRGAKGLELILFWVSCVPVSSRLHRGSARSSPLAPPFSARVARPPGGGQGGWGFPAGPPTDHNHPLRSPSAPARPRRPNHPLPLPSALIQHPSAPVHQSRISSSCVRPDHHNTSFDTFTFIFHPQPAPVPASHSPVHLTTSPPQRTLCAGAFVSKLFVSRSPSLHHLHTYTAFHSQSPRGQSLKPQPAARAVEDAIA